MRAGKWMSALLLLALSSAPQASNVAGVNVAHFEPLERLTIEQPGVARGEFDTERAASVTFDAMGRSFDLELEPNAALFDDAARVALGSEIGVYRGRIEGDANSWVRLTLVDGVPRGLIWDGRELLAVESPDDGLLATAGPAMFRLADVSIAPGVMSCGVQPLPTNGAAIYNSVVRELAQARVSGPGAVDEITVAAIGDSDFTSIEGANAIAAIAARLNNVDGIFSQQLAIQITVGTIETFDDANDPFSDVTDASDLLTEVADYRAMTPAQNQAGLTHLFTGRDLDGTTAGIAFVGAICSSRFGAGLAEGVRNLTIDTLISAHEIGHNFGADHDGDADGSCPAEPETFLMAATVGPANNMFGPCSIGVMQAEAAAASCVTPLPAVDMTVSAVGQPTSILLGNAANITFDVTNGGTLDATGVSAEVTLPNNVTLIGATASQGTCTDGAGTVSCTLGGVSGGAGGTVTVTASTDAVGAAPFAATVMADVDANVNNNQTVLPLTIDPAVNLVVSGVVSGPNSPIIGVDQTTSVGASMTNTSILDANNVTVSVTLDPGLRAESASLTGGDCTVLALQVDCTLATFASQATTDLSLTVTGLTAGLQEYTVTAAAAEADADPANNSAQGAVNVRTNTGGGNDGGSGDDGGGGSGPLFLTVLGGLLWRRLRHAR